MPRDSDMPSAWPTPRKLAGWLILATIVAAIFTGIANAFYVRSTIYDVDQKSQVSINAKVERNVEVITVHLDAIRAQLDDAKKQQSRMDEKLDRLMDKVRSR